MEFKLSAPPRVSTCTISSSRGTCTTNSALKRFRFLPNSLPSMELRSAVLDHRNTQLLKLPARRLLGGGEGALANHVRYVRRIALHLDGTHVRVDPDLAARRHRAGGFFDPRVALAIDPRLLRAQRNGSGHCKKHDCCLPPAYCQRHARLAKMRDCVVAIAAFRKTLVQPFLISGSEQEYRDTISQSMLGIEASMRLDSVRMYSLGSSLDNCCSAMRTLLSARTGSSA